MINVTRTTSKDNYAPIEADYKYKKSRVDSSTVYRDGKTSDSALININFDMNDWNIVKTSIETNLSFANAGVEFSDSRFSVTGSFTIGKKSGKISLGMNKSAELSIRADYDQEVETGIFVNVGAEEEFSNYLTAFGVAVVVVVGLCVCPIPTISHAKTTLLPIFGNA